MLQDWSASILLAVRSSGARTNVCRISIKFTFLVKRRFPFFAAPERGKQDACAPVANLFSAFFRQSYETMKFEYNEV